MAIKNSELYSSIWASCDELRGGMDARQYKDYALVLLFIKYVSDKYENDPDRMIEVPENGSFKDMIALKHNKEIGDKMNTIIGELANANDLVGVNDVADFNDDGKLGKGQEMIERLTKLIAIFEKPALDFSKNRAGGDDILGDAFEYLMKNFATESDKSKGQFSLPLILAAWHHTSPIEKQIRFKKHIQCACANNQTIEIDNYLKKLTEEEWFHLAKYNCKIK